ncbi:hypothetical protein J3R30DRAFT_415997 [Lentinula aciculospora]|uniref:GATA-type domain-containing protein n=1 Tax=Lentinula aciculospora TaxID=153920 RepID=A0A9W9DLK2_9AGAR|nr:hypothetical protein J3R30DRAFT_415997 [Lentinula aciculospora]
MNVFQFHGDHQPTNSAHNTPKTLDDSSSPSESESSVFSASVFLRNNVPSSRPSQSSSPTVQLLEFPQQRCYWALLSADLEFMYIDPAMQSDIGGTIVGRSLLEFVHPEEKSTAQQDLGLVLQSNTVHGSITHVRFSRISRIRRILKKEAFSSDKSLEDEFFAANLVINLACEGLILCFVHATLDINSGSDNDEHVKSSWTNWCSTPFVSEAQLEILSQSLLMCAPKSSHGRVFQILDNTSARLSLLTWPPQEGSSDKDITELAKSVDLCGDGSSIPQAKTNCTRRFRDLRELHGTEVESVYIPHGSVIFACHKLSTSPSTPSSATHSQSTKPPSPSSISQNSTAAFMGYNGSSSTSYSLPPPPPHQQSFYDAQYSLPPLASSALSTNSYAYSPGQPTLPASNQYSYPGHWTNSASHPSIQNLRSGYQWNHGSTNYENGSSISASLPLSGGHQPHGSYGRPLLSYGSHMPYSSTSSHNAANRLDGLNGNTPSPTSATSPTSDLVPPSRRRISPGLSPEHRGTNGASGGSQRAHGNRPTGLLKCSSCKTTSSPEWRKGPSGKKELCNACGLRYARSRAKKEGHVVSNSGRKRKDKIVKRESSTPPSATSATGSVTSSYSTSGVASYHSSSTPPVSSTGSWRRSYVSSYDSVGSFSSGNDMYASSRSVGTPSPSPPAGAATSAGGYSHYVNTSSDSVGHAHHPSRTSYYGSSIPSPLVVNPPLLQTQSFERDHRDREGYPLTPVSAASYYEATSYDRERKDAPREFEKEYEREYEHDTRDRSLVTG